MKIRMRHNSVRLRLLRAEVEALARGERIAEAIVFGSGPTQRFEYALAQDPRAAQVSADLDGARVTVHVPATLAREWSVSEVVGIEHQQTVGDGQQLHILIEKDFACLQPRSGDEDDGTFVNPKAADAH